MKKINQPSDYGDFRNKVILGIGALRCILLLVLCLPLAMKIRRIGQRCSVVSSKLFPSSLKPKKPFVFVQIATKAQNLRCRKCFLTTLKRVVPIISRQMWSRSLEMLVQHIVNVFLTLRPWKMQSQWLLPISRPHKLRCFLEPVLVSYLHVDTSSTVVSGTVQMHDSVKVI